MISTFYLPTKIIFGCGSADQLGEEAKEIGRKAMIVTYPDIRRVGLLDRVVEDLKTKGVDTLVFENVEPNPRSSAIDEGASIAHSEKFGLIIGLGGGSAMDTAKGIALASTGTESIRHYLGRWSGVKAPGITPIIQVPTLAGTGSEVNHKAIITNSETHEKSGVGSPSLFAKVTIIDPELTLTLPKRQTASGGFDIFTHVADDYIANEVTNPVNDRLREALMRVVIEYLPQAIARLDDIEARTQLSWASTIACSQLIEFPGGHFGLGELFNSHTPGGLLSGLYDITHGEALAAVFPAWMRYILPVRKERIDLLGKNVFGKEDGILAVEEWLEEIGMKLRLRDVGCPPECVEELKAFALKSARWSHRTQDVEAIAQIYRDSY